MLEMPDEKFRLPLSGTAFSAAQLPELRAAGTAYQPLPLPRPDWSGEIVRPDDLLYLVVSAYNLRPRWLPTGPRLERIAPNAPARLVFELPPQAIAEQAYFEPSDIEQHARPKPPDAPPEPSKQAEHLAGDETARARTSRPSRLVFRLPEDMDAVPLSIEGLLAWDALEPELHPLAPLPRQPSVEQLRAAPPIGEPEPLQTVLELPYRLFLSPNSEARWIHSPRPVTASGRTELWHTRLAAPGPDDELTEASATHTIPLRALWSPDFHHGGAPDKNEDDPDLGTSTMTPNDRHQIVALTSNFYGFHQYRVPPVQPTPVEAQQLMLSSLGGWLRSRGNWDLPEVAGGGAQPPHAKTSPLELRLPVSRAIPLNRGLLDFLEDDDVFARRPRDDFDLTEWVHVATQGRDHYVRLVYDGCLYPLGHRASLIKITERRFEEIGNAPVALLRQFVYVVVREPERAYPRDDRKGREMPLSRVRIKTLVTPHLRKPTDAPAHIPNTDGSFWMLDRHTGRDVPFEMVGYDAAGRAVPFSMPLIFVRRGEKADPDPNDNVMVGMAAVRHAWSTQMQGDGVTPRREAVVNGALMDFAPGGPPGDNSVLPVRALYFDVVGNGGCGEYRPKLFKAQVTLPSVEQLVGAGATMTISLFDAYLNGGFDADIGLFARIEADAGPVEAAGSLTLGFNADQAGGIATPNVQLTGLSTKRGPLAGDLADAVQNKFDPKKFFGGLPGGKEGLLFGAFSLADLLPEGSLTADAPSIETYIEMNPARGRIAVTRYAWETTPKAYPGDENAIVRFVPDGDACRLKLDARVETALSDRSSRSTMKGSLHDFRVELFEAVTVRFSAFTFSAPSGEKLDVNVVLNPAKPLEFGGDLDFVRKLSELIPPGLFGDGPSVDVRPDSVAVGFDISLPPVTVGVFTMKNLGLNAGLLLPFTDGKPVLDFGFARRQSPFLLTVSLFGGGGFVHVQLDTSGMKLVEAALEFGASCDFDIGVASGNVHVFAGIYFKLEQRNNKMQVVLTGYLRMGGALCVLGIITVSVEFNLSFTYQTNKCTGRATLIVDVEVACFSKSVELTVERSFGRDGGDPTFGHLIHTPAVWAEYANAFA
jgi:hypothetical protein